MSEKNIQEGALRRRKEWTSQFSKVREAETLESWLFEISQLLAIPEYAKAHVTRFHATSGKALDVTWKKDHSSYLRNITLLSGNGRMVPEALYPVIKQLFEEIDDPRIYMVQEDIWLTLSRDQVHTGGGHNEAPVYERGLVIRIAHRFDLKAFNASAVK